MSGKNPKKTKLPPPRLKKAPWPRLLGPFAAAWKKMDGKKTVSGLALALGGALVILIPKQAGVQSPVLDSVGWKMIDAGLAMAFGIGLPHKIIKWLQQNTKKEAP